MSKNKAFSPHDEFKRVREAVEDFVFENQRFPGVTEIAKRTNIPPNRIRSILETLEGQKQLCIVYQAPSHPTLYACTYMMQEIQRSQVKPQWASAHSFPERNELEQQIASAKDALTKYDLLEGLLYRTDISLEDSVECALRLVEFENVQRYPDKNNPDITFKAKGKKFVSEVKGKSKEAEKDDILQLEGWVRAELEKDADSDALVGMLFINHYRNNPPEERGDFLGQHAKKFAKIYRFKVLTTVHLFELTQQVLKESLTKEEARDLIIEGENYG